jgi:hypothetical protein
MLTRLIFGQGGASRQALELENATLRGENADLRLPQRRHDRPPLRQAGAIHLAAGFSGLNTYHAALTYSSGVSS